MNRIKRVWAWLSAAAEQMEVTPYELLERRVARLENMVDEEKRRDAGSGPIPLKRTAS